MHVVRLSNNGILLILISCPPPPHKLKFCQQHHTGKFTIHTTVAFAWKIEEIGEKLQLGYLVFQPRFTLWISRI
jgi:hypothetical protein